MGRVAGALTLLVRTGYGAQVCDEQRVAADYIVDDLPAAAKLIQALLRREMGIGRSRPDDL
jgi:hypothetical protein